MSIFISCGEPSGDYYAGLIIKALRESTEEPIVGMLGKEGIKATGTALWSIDQLSLMGSSDIVAAVPRLWRLKNTIASYIVREQPRRVIVIDSPDFHLPLVRTLRKKGFRNPVIYVAPPTVWAWRKKRVKALRRYCTFMLPLLGFEHRYLRDHNVPSVWVGHPFLDLKNFSFTDPSSNIIALLPGSRKSEVERLLPVLKECASQFHEMGYQPVFSIAPGLSSKIKKKMKEELHEWQFFEGNGKELMKQSCIVIGASGTVALEAMMVNRFMIVIYKGSWLSWRIYKNFVKTPWVSLPNIMAQEKIYPELLQEDASCKNIMKEATNYLQDRKVQQEKHEALKRARDDMGKPGALALWQKVILEGERQ